MESGCFLDLIACLGVSLASFLPLRSFTLFTFLTTTRAAPTLWKLCLWFTKFPRGVSLRLALIDIAHVRLPKIIPSTECERVLVKWLAFVWNAISPVECLSPNNFTYFFEFAAFFVRFLESCESTRRFVQTFTQPSSNGPQQR